MTPRHLLALALALACLAGVVFLQGCATVAYRWYPSNAPKMDYYRWEVVDSVPGFALLCGFAPDMKNGGGACVIRLREAIVKPGDVRLDNGQVATEKGTGSVCLVLATMSEDEAARMMDAAWENTLRDHEVEQHCRMGLNHSKFEGMK